LQPWRAEGLEIVRYSPNEQTIADNAGTDAVIRFYKDPDEYTGWTGERKEVINFTQSLQERGRFTGYRVLQRVMSGVPSKVYGPNNEDLGDLGGGLLKYSEQLQVMQQARAYLYHGTYPASYTLSFIEAMMTGTPMVAVGPELGNGDMFPEQRTYEIPSIIQHGVSGFISDDPHQLKHHIDRLMQDSALAHSISAFGRARAIELFGKAKIRAEWKDYLG
jgi:glycosyltransferase involved in cell wall biosynthesis